MVNPFAVAFTLALLVAALIGMAVSWRRRAGRQRALALPAVPEVLGAPGEIADGMYLATTFAGRPLERVVAGELGFRAEARITVTDAGVLVTRAGGPDLYLATERLQGVGAATWTIDRTVERDGLTVLAWRLGDGDEAVDVESSFRLDADARRSIESAVRELVPARPEVPSADS